MNAQLQIPDFIFAVQFDSHWKILNSKTDIYYALDPECGIVFENIRAGKSFQEILQVVSSKFQNQTPSELSEIIHILLDDLKAKGLVTWK